MDAGAFFALAATCAPLVHPSTAQAIVAVESRFNPNAIGVVGGMLERQPRDTIEALATARSLHDGRWNFSVGLAQINVHNLDRFGMTLADGLDPCKNLQAMQRVLSDCYVHAAAADGSQPALRRALSCYYSGSFTTGFHHGYVNRVVGNARAPP